MGSTEPLLCGPELAAERGICTLATCAPVAGWGCLKTSRAAPTHRQPTAKCARKSAMPDALKVPAQLLVSRP